MILVALGLQVAKIKAFKPQDIIKNKSDFSLPFNKTEGSCNYVIVFENTIVSQPCCLIKLRFRKYLTKCYWIGQCYFFILLIVHKQNLQTRFYVFYNLHCGKIIKRYMKSFDHVIIKSAGSYSRASKRPEISVNNFISEGRC